MKKSTNVAVHLISAAILLGDFLLCRYLFFDLHGMKDWPVFMLGLGIALLVISFLLKGQHLPLISANGYLAGFVAGLVFRTNGVDPGGGRTNNMWLIWLVVWLGVALIGVTADIFLRGKGE